MGAFLALALIFYFVVKLSCDASAVAKCKREGREAFQRAVENGEKWKRETAAKNDYWYDPSTQVLNTNHYSDGSVRFDPGTGKAYQKGEKFRRSNGWDANYRREGEK